MTLPDTAIPIRLDDSVRGRVRVGVVGAAPVVVGPSAPDLMVRMRDSERSMHERFAGMTPARIEPLHPAREFYRSFGIDPTKTRPSSEALLRRILKGKTLPQIINAVDLCNVLSVSFLLPIGLYDAAKIEGPVELRQGRVGESFVGIRKGQVHLEGRPVLVDSRGPFGNPTSDSARTSVDESTIALWMTIFAPRSLSTDAMRQNVDQASRWIATHLCGGDAPVATSGAVVD
jgi:DNA/RNA-binding domain of Phe-tRNA-synthetase-like protein